MEYEIRTVDVFTSRALEGNQLAVVLDAGGIDQRTMQAFAREMNLSETVFVTAAPDAASAAAIRIFTPAAELPFAGHPTLGTAYVLWSEGLIPGHASRFTISERIGPIEVRVEQDSGGASVWMTQPAVQFGATFEDRALIAQALGLTEEDLVPGVPVQGAGVGVPFLMVPLRDAATVDAAQSDERRLAAAFGSEPKLAVVVFAQAGAGRLYSRMFAPHVVGIAEDPATGSAAGALGAFAVRHGLIERAGEVAITNEQGTKMGRRSLLHVRLTYSGPDELPARVEVGGQVVPVIRGRVTLEPAEEVGSSQHPGG